MNPGLARVRTSDCSLHVKVRMAEPRTVAGKATTPPAARMTSYLGVPRLIHAAIG